MAKKIILLTLIGIIIAFLAVFLVEKPKVEKQAVREPEVGELKGGRPKVEKPELEKPKVEKPEVGKPDKDIVVTKKAVLPTRRSYLACAENSATHKIYCFGGHYYNGGDYFFNEIVEYDPAEDTLTAKRATLPTGRSALSCVENSATHKIYCFGGWDGNFFNEIVEYDPATDTLTIKTAVLPTGRGGFACAENSLTNKIYCFGGDDGRERENYLNEIVEYDPATDTLTTKTATLPTGRMNLACAENSATHKIYCFGGWGERYQLDEIIKYDPATDTLTTKTATLLTGLDVLSCIENSATNKIYCFGGPNLNEIIKYDPATDTLTTKTATLLTRRYGFACAENSATHKIYCFGGYDGRGNFSNQILEYDPARDM